MAERASHTRFAIFNHTVNPVVRALLSSPLHGIASSGLVLLTVTGRVSGQEHTFPVAYRQQDEVVTVVVGWPERKRWWRNLTGAGAPVRLRLRGQERTGHALASGDEDAGVEVRIALDPA